MKALTVKQPWAGAIFATGKDVENRSWRTSYRGPLVIHAGAGFDKADPRLVEFAKRCGDTGVWSPSAAIGVVTLVDCVQGHASEWAVEGYWHWVLRSPRALPQPVPMKGRLSLWTPPPLAYAGVA